jgi:hypothetical protein
MDVMMMNYPWSHGWGRGDEYAGGGELFPSLFPTPTLQEMDKTVNHRYSTNLENGHIMKIFDLVRVYVKT